jgi:hypothetical protein
VFDIEQEFAFRYTVAPQLVSDNDVQHILKTLQQPLEEARRRAGIAVALYQDSEYDTVLIDSAPEIA